jgi:hypothetical protein
VIFQTPWKDSLIAANGVPVQQNFANWFGCSQVVDDAGVPRVVFHGTRHTFGAFTKRGSTNEAIYFSDTPDGADSYARDLDGEYVSGSNVVPAFLSLQRPLLVDLAGEDDIDGLYFHIERAREEGCDGVIARNGGDGYGRLTQYVAFDPGQVKSAIGNSGLYGHGESICDEDGHPIVAFHGGKLDGDVFQDRATFFTASRQTAEGYAARAGEGGQVIAAYLTIKNPKVLDFLAPNTPRWYAQKRRVLMNQGFNGMVIGGDTFVAFHPSQITVVSDVGSRRHVASTNEETVDHDTSDHIDSVVDRPRGGG